MLSWRICKLWFSVIQSNSRRCSCRRCSCCIGSRATVKPKRAAIHYRSRESPDPNRDVPRILLHRVYRPRAGCAVDEARELSLFQTPKRRCLNSQRTQDHHSHGLTPSSPHTSPTTEAIYSLVYISAFDDLKSLRLTGHRPSCVLKRSRPKQLRTVPYAPFAPYASPPVQIQVPISNMKAGARIPHRCERHHSSTARRLPFSAPPADDLTRTYIEPCSYPNTLTASYCLTSRQPGR